MSRLIPIRTSREAQESGYDCAASMLRIVHRSEEEPNLPYQVQYYDEWDDEWITEAWCISYDNAQEYLNEQQE